MNLLSYGPRASVALLFAANGLIVGAWAPQIPVLRSRLGIGEGELGLLILTFGLGALAAMPLAGRAIARIGSRPVALGAGLATAAGLLPVVSAPHPLTAAAALFVFGAVVGVMDVAMNANAVAAEHRLGRALMSSSHGFWSVGGFVGAAAGGALLQASGPLMQAGAAGLACLLLVILARPGLVSEEAAPEDVPVSAAWPRHFLPYAFGLVALFAMIPEGAVLDWAAIHLASRHEATVAVAALAFGLFSAAMAVMRFAGDRLRARYGGVRVMRVSALVAGAALLFAALAPTAGTAIALFAVAGLGLANIVPIAFSAAGGQPGLAPGIGMSVATTMGYSGILVAPSAIGFVGERTGFTPVFAVLGLGVLVLALAAPLARHADRAR